MWEDTAVLIVAVVFALLFIAASVQVVAREDPRAELVLLHSTACPYCKQFYPVWDQMRRDPRFRSVRMISIDIDLDPVSATKYRVGRTVPEILLLRGGIKRMFAGSRTPEALLEFTRA